MPVDVSHHVQSNKYVDNNGHQTDVNNSENLDTNGDDFVVIWRNLSYKIDLKRWYHLFNFTRQSSSNEYQPRDRSSSARSSIPSENHLSEDNYLKSQSTGTERIILDNISGHAASRKLTAIMGPSGAGKSSLLHCLFQGRTTGTSGEILVEGRYNKKLKVCFIPQHDHLNEWLTVREDLMFVSKLKQTKTRGLVRRSEKSASNTPIIRNNESNLTSRAEFTSFVHGPESNEICSTLIDHESNVLRVAELLGLTNCLDVNIKKISGGEKKRLSIARELMSEPDMLILDEPTTGLDSLTCYKTVMVLRDLVKQSLNPIAVVVTIHQPEQSVFNLFDKAYYIAKKGKVVYDDNPRNATEIIETIARCQLPSSNYNPAAFLIEISSEEIYEDAKDRLVEHFKIKFNQEFNFERLKKIVKDGKSQRFGVQGWLRITEAKDTTVRETSLSGFNDQAISTPSKGEYRCANSPISIEEQTDITSVERFADGASISSKSYYVSPQLRNCLASHANGWAHSFRQVSILTHRSWLSIIRNPAMTKTKLLYYTMLPAVMLFVFGSKMGRVNSCPKVGTIDIDIPSLLESADDNTIAENLESSRYMLENMSFYFLLLYGFSINVIGNSASYYPQTLNIFKKEMINGLYSAGPYYIGQTLAELPFEAGFSFISIICTWHISGQQSSFLQWRMLSTAGIFSLCGLLCYAIGLLSGLLFPHNMSLAVMVGQASLLPFIFSSGFIIRKTRMPPWMRAFAIFTPVMNAFQGILLSRYGFNVCECDEEELLENQGSLLAPNMKNLMNYMFPPDSEMDGLNVTEMFEQLKNSYLKAQTFGLEIKNCGDVKPYILRIYDVLDNDLFLGIGNILTWIIALRVIVFLVMRKSHLRIN